MIKFELVNHGIDSPDNFQGCGVAFTDYTDCITGIGSTPRSAASDALELLCQSVDLDAADLEEIEGAIQTTLSNKGLKLKGESYYLKGNDHE